MSTSPGYTPTTPTYSPRSPDYAPAAPTSILSNPAPERDYFKEQLTPAQKAVELVDNLLQTLRSYELEGKKLRFSEEDATKLSRLVRRSVASSSKTVHWKKLLRECEKTTRKR